MPDHVILFPPFRLDRAAGRLFRGDEPVALRPKTYATLCALAARPGELVTKDDLLRDVWPDVAVTEDMPRFSVRELRRALGDDPAAPRIIETVHGRGYRFIATIGPPATARRDGDDGRDPSGAIVVGREAELATLADWLAAARAGDRTVGFLAGDAGIGKTTLVDAFLAHAIAAVPGLVVARGECREVIGTDEPYRPLLEALHALATGPHGGAVRSALRIHAPTWLAQLPSLLDADEETALRGRLFGSTSERMVRELAGVVEALSASTPLLLALEDLHWSDHATLDALVAVTRGRAAAHLLVVGTYRPIETIVANHPLRGIVQELRRRRLCRELALSALGRDAVRTYLHARFGTAANEDVVAFVHERSDGNPFFMTAVADQLAEADFVGPHRLDVPDTLREMIERQLEILDPATLVALEAAAVVGTEFSPSSVAAALGEPNDEAVEDRLDGLARQRRLLRPVTIGVRPGEDGTRYAFRHGLYRDVLYGRMAPSRRRRLHQATGEHLESRQRSDAAVAAELGHHFERSGDRARAVTHLGRAAEMAQKRFADREAIAYLERALALLEVMPPSATRTQDELFLRLLLAPSLTATKGHRSDALAVSSARVAMLCRDLGDTPGHLFALLTLFSFELMRGRLDAATEIGERALALGPLVSASFVGAGQMASGITRCYRGELERGRGLLEEALTDPAVLPAIFDPRIVSLSHLADRALVYLGYPEQAVARGEQCLARAAELGHPFSQAVADSTIARMFVVLRDPDAALRLAERCLALCAEHGFADIAHRTRIIHGWARALRGDAPDVVDELLPLIETYDRAGMVAITSAHLSVVEAAVAAGRLDDALHVLLTAARLVEDTGERMEEAEVHRWRGEVLVALGGRQAWPEAEACFRRALEVARSQSARWLELRAAVSLTRLEVDRGRGTDGRQALAPLVAWFREGFDRPDLREARTLLARLP